MLQRRRRRHLAVLSALLLVTIFGFGLLRPRHVRVQADGRELSFSTNIANNDAVLSASGISLHPGDRVTALRGPGADVLRIERAHDVTVRVDGVTYAVRTHAVTIDQLLAEMDIATVERDTVLQNGELVSPNAPVEPPRLFATRIAQFGESDAKDIAIEVRRAVPFTVVEDGRELLTTSSRPTVAQALREAGVTTGPGDAITPDAQSPLDENSRIEVRHAKAVTVTMPDTHRVLYTLAATVGEALASAGISVPSGAFIEPSPETPVRAGMSVRVVQLSGSSDSEREYIESGTVYKPDANLAAGESRTVSGHDGARVRRYSVTYVDGNEAGRELIDEYFDPEPVDTVIYYSTRSSEDARDTTPPADDGNGDSSGGGSDGGGSGGGASTRTLRVYATWYRPSSSGRSSSDPDYGRTATGVVVTYGVVAVDPNVIPLGTKMYIPGYGNAIAADTGGAVKGYIIDLGYPDGVTVDWQSKWVDIQILS